MTREQKYTSQLKELGIYQEAFAPEIHDLAMMERELQRMLKGWKNGGALAGTKEHDAIMKQRRDILAHRDSLGLTPKGLYRLKNSRADPPSDDQTSVLAAILERRREI